MSKKRKAVVILGMHRSGTSLITRAVKSLGVYIGHDEEMLQPAEDNPEGFWEHSEIVEIHDRLLQCLSVTWDTTKPLPNEWWLLDDIQQYKVLIKEVIHKHFATSMLWGFKDPRTCILLPMWKEIFQQLNIEPVYVICMRNPLNVIGSLHKRDNFTKEKSAALWTSYVISSLYYTISEKRIVVSYDRLMETPTEVGEEICRFLNIGYTDEKQQLMRALPNNDLRHNYRQLNDLLQAEDMPNIVKQLYTSCLRLEEKMDNELNGYISGIFDHYMLYSTFFDHEQAYRMKFYWSGDRHQFVEEQSTYISIAPSETIETYKVKLKGNIGTTLKINLFDKFSIIKINSLSISKHKQHYDLLIEDCLRFNNFQLLDEQSKQVKYVGITSGKDAQLIIHNLPDIEGDVTLTIQMSCSFEVSKELVASLVKQRAINENASTINKQIEQLEQNNIEIERLSREVILYQQSFSWRVTKPLRWMTSTYRKLKKESKLFVLNMRATVKINRITKKPKLSKRLSYSNYVLIISHTNYLYSLGGTEKYIYEQIEYLKEQSIGAIQLFPAKAYGFLNSKEEAKYGVIVDGNFKGFYSIRNITEWLHKLSITVQQLYTHHLLNWRLKDYVAFVHETTTLFGYTNVLYVHDFFSMCSSYHMMYEPNTSSYVKGAVEKRTCIYEIKSAYERGEEASICNSCRFVTYLKEWRQAIESILEKANYVVVPSNFVKDIFEMIYKNVAHKVMVKGHLIFSGQTIVSKLMPTERKLKIAYLGYKTENKGFKVWESLYKNEALRQHYDFYHFGAQENYSEHVSIYKYSFIDDGKMAATNLLIEHEIDFVLLWSIVPESYSYTLQEAIAAGVPILTSPVSGNIAATIRANPELGKIFKDQKQMLAFILNIEAAKDYITGDRARYVLHHNHLPVCKEEPIL